MMMMVIINRNGDDSNSIICYIHHPSYIETQVLYDVWDVWYDDNDLTLWYIQW